MRRTGPGIPLRDRVRGSPGRPSPAASDDVGGRHCWVLDAADGHGVKRAGLLLEWRRTTTGGWEGRVVYVALLRPDGWAAVEEWLPSERLAPA